MNQNFLDANFLQRVLHIETLAANAWPANEVIQLDGWRLRATFGVTGRANSVWPNLSENLLTLEEKVQTVEAFYAYHGLPARYQVSPACQPPHLDQALAERDYTLFSPTCVQTVRLHTLLANTNDLTTAPQTSAPFEIEIRELFNGTWFEAYCLAEAVEPSAAQIRRGILERIYAHTGYATLRIGGVPAAIALGVVEDGWLGLFNIETRAEFRRLRAATALINALAAWSVRYGAQESYLQVVEANSAARALYQKLGFDTLYRYHYRIKQAEP
jgi:GNAT superfamily N-acetyltransferase